MVFVLLVESGISDISQLGGKERRDYIGSTGYKGRPERVGV